MGNVHLWWIEQNIAWTKNYNKWHKGRFKDDNLSCHGDQLLICHQYDILPRGQSALTYSVLVSKGSTISFLYLNYSQSYQKHTRTFFFAVRIKEMQWPGQIIKWKWYLVYKIST